MAKKVVTGLVLSIVAKCSDMCVATLLENNKVLKENDGYVPRLMPGQHWGDYIEIDIEVATGLIINWKVPSKTAIAKFIKTGE